MTPGGIYFSDAMKEFANGRKTKHKARWKRKVWMMISKYSVTDIDGTCYCGNCGESVGFYPYGYKTPVKFCEICPGCRKVVKWE